MVLADYVTTEAGTGCVHTAPGHGADDYQTGLRYGLDILSPVDDEGVFTAEAGPYAGQQIPAVNKLIIEDMRRRRRADPCRATSTTAIPHCWRCKKPVIYRATPQWFHLHGKQRPAPQVPGKDQEGGVDAVLGHAADLRR